MFSGQGIESVALESPLLALKEKTCKKFLWFLNSQPLSFPPAASLFAPCLKADLTSAVVKSTLQSQQLLMFLSRPRQADNQLGECVIITPTDIEAMAMNARAAGGSKGKGERASCPLCGTHGLDLGMCLLGCCNLGNVTCPV